MGGSTMQPRAGRAAASGRPCRRGRPSTSKAAKARGRRSSASSCGRIRRRTEPLLLAFDRVAQVLAGLIELASGLLGGAFLPAGCERDEREYDNEGFHAGHCRLAHRENRYRALVPPAQLSTTATT